MKIKILETLWLTSLKLVDLANAASFKLYEKVLSAKNRK